MAFLHHVLLPAMVLAIALLLLLVIARFTPARRLNWRWTILPAFGLLWPLGTWLHARSSLRQWLEDNHRTLSQREAPGHQYYYMLHDYIPTYRYLGGAVSPELRAFVHRTERHSAPCRRKTVHELLGEGASSELVEACRAIGEGNTIAGRVVRTDKEGVLAVETDALGRLHFFARQVRSGEDWEPDPDQIALLRTLTAGTTVRVTYEAGGHALILAALLATHPPELPDQP